MLRTLLPLCGLLLSAVPFTSHAQVASPDTPTANCPASNTLQTGVAGGGWYNTVAPSEHFNSARSQVFPNTCTLAQITSSPGPYRINSRIAPGSYPNLYNIATRRQNELFVYGGYAGEGGSYVAKIDPATLFERWRVTLTIPSTQWSFLGAMGVLGDGEIYSVQSNLLAKIDPETGHYQTLELPQLAPPTGTGAAYNGFVATPGGLLILKSIERGPCSDDDTGGIECAISNNLPGTIVVVDPVHMKVMATATTSEPALGRISVERHDGVDFIYVPGVTQLVRYRYTRGELTLDSSWGPIPYGDNGFNGGGVGLIGGFAVVQTNYAPSSVPSWIVAANIHDSSRHFAIQPFRSDSTNFPYALSWVPSKAVLDEENNRIYIQDTYAGQVAGLEITGNGLKVLWKVNNVATGFVDLLGSRHDRQLVMPDKLGGYDTIAWRDPNTGKLVARSRALVESATIGVPAPGFSGRFYYPSLSTGQLIELTPEAQQQGVLPKISNSAQ